MSPGDGLMFPHITISNMFIFNIKSSTEQIRTLMVNELIYYFLPHKMLSLAILITLIATWLNKFKNTTCLSLFSSLLILSFGATIIYIYPSGAFACDVCEISYWIPYFVLPFIIFFFGLAITRVVRVLKIKIQWFLKKS